MFVDRSFLAAAVLILKISLADPDDWSKGLMRMAGFLGTDHGIQYIR
jgi:hypothetical protein